MGTFSTDIEETGDTVELKQTKETKYLSQKRLQDVKKPNLVNIIGTSPSKMWNKFNDTRSKYAIQIQIFHAHATTTYFAHICINDGWIGWQMMCLYQRRMCWSKNTTFAFRCCYVRRRMLLCFSRCSETLEFIIVVLYLVKMSAVIRNVSNVKV